MPLLLRQIFMSVKKSSIFFARLTCLPEPFKVLPLIGIAGNTRAKINWTNSAVGEDDDHHQWCHHQHRHLVDDDIEQCDRGKITEQSAVEASRWVGVGERCSIAT